MEASHTAYSGAPRLMMTFVVDVAADTKIWLSRVFGAQQQRLKREILPKLNYKDDCLSL
jgi:hypothetical protein